MTWYTISWQEYVTVTVPRRWPGRWLKSRKVSEWQDKHITVDAPSVDLIEMSMRHGFTRIEKAKIATPYVDG